MKGILYISFRAMCMLALVVTMTVACTGNSGNAAAASAKKATTVSFGDAIANDMVGPNDALPHGVPDSWDWANDPVIHSGNNPGSRQAFTAWGQIYQTIEGGDISEVRLEVRNLTGYMLRKSDNSWVLLRTEVKPWGDNYTEDFGGPIQKAVADSIPGGGIWAKPVAGYNYHFYWHTRAKIDTSDVAGFVVWFEGRVASTGPKGKPSLNQAKFLGSAGADYYPDAKSYDAGAVAHGKMKFLTEKWQRCYMTTVSREVLKENPPPDKSADTSATLIR